MYDFLRRMISISKSSHLFLYGIKSYYPVKNQQIKILIRATTLLFFIADAGFARSQAVTEIVTTYKNYWKSSSTSINSIKPDTSHTLLAFTYNNIRYSTGVDNAKLATHGDFFIPEDFRALSVAGMTGSVTSNTKIGLGALYDCVANGPSNPPPANNLNYYMTDGVKGLNIGTGVANLPTGTITFGVSNLQASAIGDGVPDILVTQIADPSGSADQYEFTTSGGTGVGNLLSVNFASVNPVANWTADFYEASTNPMTLQSGFTQTDRPLRVWAADFSDFGITAANANTISRFVIHLNGNSDIAFVAYNYAAANILPVRFTDFHSTVIGKDIQLSWQTATESNSKNFVIETSIDGQRFTALDSIPAAGNSSSVKNYSYRHVGPGAGPHYYRVRETDMDGKYYYTNTLRETLLSLATITIFPMPARSNVTITHSSARSGDRINVYTINGILVLDKSPATGSTQTTIDVSSYNKGTYIITWKRLSGEMITQKLIVQ